MVLLALAAFVVAGALSILMPTPAVEAGLPVPGGRWCLASGQTHTNFTTGAISLDSVDQSTYRFSVTASGLPAKSVLVDVRAKLNDLTYSNADDLDIYFRSPEEAGRQTLELMSDAGGQGSLSNIDLTFGDSFSSQLPDESAIASESYKPTDHDPYADVASNLISGNVFSGYNGINPVGEWDILVRDDTSSNAGTGSMFNWQLQLCTVVDNTPPAAPSFIAHDSTGVDPNDEVTNENQPGYTGNAEARTTIKIYEGTTLLRSGASAYHGNGNWTVYSGYGPILPDGHHYFRATATDTVGNVSGYSNTDHLYIDTQAPAAPTFDLDAASDSGRLDNDNVTNDTTPTFIGDAETSAQVLLYDATDAIVVGSADNEFGAYALTVEDPYPPLADGPHDLSMRQRDVAGNIGPNSASLAVTIDTLAPAMPSFPDLAAASDTGTDTDDNITSDVTPTLNGVAGMGSDVVQIFDGATSLGTAPVSPDGPWSFTSGRLRFGRHNLKARVLDLAGNPSPRTAALSVLIGPACFGEPSTITGTNAADDLVGTAGNDVISGLGGNDDIDGRGGNDLICGGNGNDRLDGGPGADRLNGGAGTDTALFPGATGRTINLGTGAASGEAAGVSLVSIENVVGSNGADSITGNNAANRLEGLGGSDNLNGSGGDDVLFGGDDDDTLTGAAGDDTLNGGDGTDTCNGGSGTNTLGACE
ncbi:MAG: Ig-like domain-containing protein [Dehalococcoidia bacterium]